MCRQVAEPTPEDTIRAHSDFSDVIDKLEVHSDVGQYFLNVVTPRLGRLPFIAPEKKRKLVTLLGKQLKDIEARGDSKEE
jgi:hypothetical protein